MSFTTSSNIGCIRWILSCSWTGLISPKYITRKKRTLVARFVIDLMENPHYSFVCKCTRRLTQPGRRKYKNWYQGGVTTNPISWDTQTTSKIIDHRGVLSEDSKIYPKTLSVRVIDGLLWTTLPQIPGRFFLSLIENYHFADINLFWKDIEENAIVRVNAWYQKKSDEKDN